ncbi:hypothetical protein L7F22_066365 [Adiantum nelumboides]|nr:hypothetical protein [Adiantum nelumboides]
MTGVKCFLENKIACAIVKAATYLALDTAAVLLQIAAKLKLQPIRVFSNIEVTTGVPYLDKQPMRILSSIWNGDSWATRGGQVKLDWAHAPFIARYRNFVATGSMCTNATSATTCSTQATRANTTEVGEQQVDTDKLKWVQSNFMVYDYCMDQSRYPVTPLECSH